VCDLITEVAGRATPRARRLGAPKPRWLRACLLAPMPWLVSQVGQEPRPELGRVADQEPKAQATPEPYVGAASCVALARFLSRMVRVSVLDECSP
jgi:hypothetical protein